MQDSEDSRLQNRIAQLNLIITRRNEFLRELFRLLRSRDDITASSLEDEDEELVMFLKRFDLNKNSGRGSISNLAEDEFSFHIRSSRSLHPNPVISPDNDNASATSSRTTQNRTRAEDSLPLEQQPTRNVAVDTEEDNDELDLIGSSGFSEEGERTEKPKLETGARGTTGNERLFSDTTTTRPRHRELANNSDPVRSLTTTTTRTETVEVESDESSRNLESSRDKDDAMDVEEVEAITKASDADGADQETSESAAVILEKSLAFVGVHKVPSRENSTSTPSKMPQPMAQITNPVSIPKPIFISTSTDEKVIKQEGGTESGVAKREATLQSHRQFNPEYSLPPLNVLPADFTKKAKPIKRKKDDQREGKRDKYDTVPMGMARWGATLMANPLWKKVSRANKTLSTREWSVAMVELRLIRTMERIEQLKNDGRWSFRQPKKQRGVGGLVKSHWDYLIDEIKWMRVDFREERRWKIALAYNLSTAVLEWHYAMTPEERQRSGITVKWRRPRVQQNIEMNMELPLDEADTAFKPIQLLGLDYGSDEDEDEEKDDRDDLLDPPEPPTGIRDALDLANDIQPKNEDVDDQSVLNLVQGEALDASPQPTPDTKPDEDVKLGLKSTSENPLLSGSKSSSQSVNGDNDTVVVIATKPPKSSLAPLREKVVHSDDLFFNPHSDTLGTISLSADDSMPQSDLNLSTLFPDLQPFGLLDVPANPDVANVETKKKSEKKSDRDDPTKRAEEMNYTKLYPSSRFMHIKPTLIGPLQPAKRFKDGSWLPIDPQSVSADTDSRISEDISNDLFDGRPSSALQFPSSLKDKDARKRAVDHLWSPDDDALLKQLVDRYSTNWTLVAECYNSARLTTPMEKRTPIDCAERWKERWGGERKHQSSEATQPAAEDGTTTSSPSQMTTRAVKRLASTSVSSAQGPMSAGEKKRRRHYLLQESIKKTAKKRSDSIQKMLANQRKPSTVHETHNQFNKLPKLTPLELARMKVDKDQRESHEVQLARRRQEEAMRQNLLREQAQRNMLQTAQGQLPQQQQQQNQPQQTQQAQPPQAPQAQVQQGQIPQQQAALTQQQQQLAQLQQLQAQQQANQAAGRVNVPSVVLQNRPNAGTPNARPVNPQTQAQLLQQARVMQLPPGAQANLAQVLSQAQAAGNTGSQLAGNPYYSLPANLGNLTQEQILNAFAMQSSQHAQQQQQQPSQLT